MIDDWKKWLCAAEESISKEKYYEIYCNGKNITQLGGYHDLSGHFEMSYKVEYGKWVYKISQWGLGNNISYGMTKVEKCDNQEGDGI